MLQFPKIVRGAVCQIDHAFTSVVTWLLGLLVTLGHVSWPWTKIQAHTPPSPAFQSHVETCQQETFWSKWTLILGISCHDETGDTLFFPPLIFIFFIIGQWSNGCSIFVGFPPNWFGSIQSWQEILQCGLYSKLLMSVRGKGTMVNPIVLALAHEEAMVRIAALLCRSLWVTWQYMGHVLQWEWTSECILLNGKTSDPFLFGWLVVD